VWGCVWGCGCVGVGLLVVGVWVGCGGGVGGGGGGGRGGLGKRWEKGGEEARAGRREEEDRRGCGGR
jgi:hypothetical protein